MFSGPFSATFGQNLGPSATKFSRPKDIFYGPFRVILKNFRPPGNSDPKRLVSLTISELTPLDPVALDQQLGFLGLAAKGLFSGHFLIT